MHSTLRLSNSKPLPILQLGLQLGLQLLAAHREPRRTILPLLLRKRDILPPRRLLRELDGGGVGVTCPGAVIADGEGVAGALMRGLGAQGVGWVKVRMPLSGLAWCWSVLGVGEGRRVRLVREGLRRGESLRVSLRFW